MNQFLPIASCLIIDLEEAARPSAKLRRKVRREFQRIGSRLSHVAVFTGRNFMLNVVAGFVLSGIPQAYSIHKTRADAEQTVRRVP